MNKIPEFEICPHCQQTVAKKGSILPKHSETVQKLYGFSLKELKEKTKARHITYARNHLWLLLCVEGGWSYPRIGYEFKFDHTSVLSGIRSIAHEFLNTPKRASLFTIVNAYWLTLGLSEEEAYAKAVERALLHGGALPKGT